MSARIDRFRRLGAGSDPPPSESRVDLSSNPIAKNLLATAGRTVDEAAIVRADRVYDKPLSVSIEERLAETLQAAIAAIRSARDEQYRLANEAEDLAESSRIKTLDSQASAQSTEITRIQSASPLNGTYIFSNTSIDISIADISRNLNTSAILPASTSISKSISASLLTPTQATAAKKLYGQALSEISSLNAGVTSIVNDVGSVAQRENPEQVRAQAEAERAGRSPSVDPTDLANAIASQITDPFITDRARQAIIDTSAEKLDPARVKRLLDEDDD